MPPFDWAKIINASVVPVVIISACGLLCLAFYNRLAAIVSRLRGFQRERLHEQQLLNRAGSEDGPERSPIARTSRIANDARRPPSQADSPDAFVPAFDNHALDRMLYDAGSFGADAEDGLHCCSTVHAWFADDARGDDRRDAGTQGGTPAGGVGEPLRVRYVAGGRASPQRRRISLSVRRRDLTVMFHDNPFSRHRDGWLRPSRSKTRAAVSSIAWSVTSKTE